MYKKKISQLWKQEEMYWGMRSRLKWAKCGDRNIKFFHATTIQRRDMNRLEKLRDENGDWIEGPDTIMSTFVKHYQDIYTIDCSQGTGECLRDINVVVPQFSMMI